MPRIFNRKKIKSNCFIGIVMQRILSLVIRSSFYISLRFAIFIRFFIVRCYYLHKSSKELVAILVGAVQSKAVVTLSSIEQLGL
jgi:hypothetical protein